MWLLEYMKAAISEHPSRINVLTGIEHSSRDRRRTFIRAFY